jgi:hypothetical protein
MRTLMRFEFPTDASNAAIKDGSFQKVMEATLERLKPEACYFWTQDAHRGGIIVFDMKEPSEMPSIAEPLFMGMNARIEFSPVMNLDDLRAGLKRASENR